MNKIRSGDIDKICNTIERSISKWADVSIKNSDADLIKTRDRIAAYNQENQRMHKRYCQNFCLLSFIVCSFIAITFMLIFLKDDTQSGFLLLSHIAAITFGFGIGMTVQSRRDKKEI